MFNKNQKKKDNSNMAPRTPLDTKEVIENSEKKREEKKTNVPINLPIRNSSSHAIIWKSYKDKEMGERDT